MRLVCCAAQCPANRPSEIEKRSWGGGTPGPNPNATVQLAGEREGQAAGVCGVCSGEQALAELAEGQGNVELNRPREKWGGEEKEGAY